MREMDTIKVSIGLLHHLLATAPYGVLRGMGNVHVSACGCSNCRKYAKAKKLRLEYKTQSTEFVNGEQVERITGRKGE